MLVLQNGELPNGRDTQEPCNAGGWGDKTKHSPRLYTSPGTYCFLLLETEPWARRSWVWVCFRYGGSGVGWGLGTTCEHLVFSCCQGPGTPEQSRKQQQQGRTHPLAWGCITPYAACNPVLVDRHKNTSFQPMLHFPNYSRAIALQ